MTDADRLHEEGLALLKAGRLDEALDRIGRALDLAAETALLALKTTQPAQKTAPPAQKTAQLHNSFGVVLAEMGEPAAAAASFRCALALAPADAVTWSNLGNAAAEAPAHRRALVLDPLAAGALGNLASLRQSAGSRAEAERLWRRALALNPAFAEAWSNLGASRQHMAELDFAAKAFPRAIAADPGFADGWFNRGLLRLLLGDYANGLADYERRWHRRGMARPDLAAPLWTGDDPKGKRLLLWAEQGHGDTIQFARFIPLLNRRGAEAVLAVPRRLMPLLVSLGDVARVVAIDGPLPVADLQAPLMSLPFLLGLGDEAAAPLASYLSPPPRPAPSPAAIARDGRPLVGLVWAGSPVNESDGWRSLALDRLRPLLAERGIRFVSLQFGPSAADIAKAGLEDRLETPALGDFAASASLVASLDLVVTVDTAMAHLAGAMGKEAWVLLAHVPDWRWGMSGETTSWYPSLRLFRQASPGDWDGVVAKLAQALGERFPGAAGAG